MSTTRRYKNWKKKILKRGNQSYPQNDLAQSLVGDNQRLIKCSNIHRKFLIIAAHTSVWYILQWVYFRQAKRLRNEQSYRACGIPAINCKQHRTHLWKSCRSRVDPADSHYGKARNPYHHRANLRKILKKKKNGVSLLQSVSILTAGFTLLINIYQVIFSRLLRIIHRITDIEKQGACQIEKRKEVQ